MPSRSNRLTGFKMSNDKPKSYARRSLLKAGSALVAGSLVTTLPKASPKLYSPGSQCGSMMLVTGGAGYIGSHTCVELLNAGYQIVVLDNLSNASSESLKRVQEIAGKQLTFIHGDIRDQALLDDIFANYPIETVIHFAGLKAVGESVLKPLEYYNNNVHGSNILFSAMKKADVRKIVFSSSATVYGQQKEMPIRETASLSHTSPYGHTKLLIEEMLIYQHQAALRVDSSWSVALLRYFNPIGAHDSGYIGEDPKGIPNNLMPYITQVSANKRPFLRVYTGYETSDGTGVRDYIHVVDLAKGHIKAIEKLQDLTGVHVWNLGVGKGYSVHEVLHAFQEYNHVNIPIQIEGRREGDVDICYASVDKAEAELGWTAQYGLLEMVKHAWEWQQKYPDGYS